MTGGQIAGFIRRNCKVMSIRSLAYELDLPPSVIGTLCRSMKIKPFSIFEEQVLFLKEWKGRINREKAMRALDVGEDFFVNLLKKAGIDVKEFPTETQRIQKKEAETKNRAVGGLSVREILGDFQFDESVHYNGVKEITASEKNWLR